MTSGNKCMATVQILVDTSNCDSAKKSIYSLLEGADGIMDWAYLKVGSQYLSPTNTFIPDDYKEGDLF